MMKKAALIYLALVLGMTALITGAPGALYSWLRSADKATALDTATPTPAEVAQTPEPTAGPDEVVAMAAPRPVLAIADEADQNSGAAAADLLAAADPAAVPVSRLAKPVVRGGDEGLDRTTSAILAELSILPATEVKAEDAALQDMSQGALAGLAALRSGGGEAAPVAPTLESLVVAALREGQPDAYIDALINEAAGSGRISVPSALVTADGRVDTAVLLSTLVTKAQVASGAVEQVDPNDVVAAGEGVEVRVTASAIGESTSNQFYTVAPGDSLGSIAQKFYGDAVYFPVIFEANRALLASPDRLSVGQRLVVPSADTL
jgi:nucleoid-associated protein YgaU